jgi:hypothetical protein
MSDDHTKLGLHKGIVLKISVSKYDDYPFMNNKIIDNYSKIKQNLNIDLGGQGHLSMKVKFSLVNLEVLTKGLLYPSMKATH